MNARATIVLIPLREIEAWLLYDAEAIAGAFKGRKVPRLPGDPESLQDPKKALRAIVWRTYRRHYLHTVHNEIIAKNVDTQRLRRARSFVSYPPFVATIGADLR